MNTATLARALPDIETPVLALLLPTGPLPTALEPLDRATGGALQRAYAAGDWKGKRDEVLVLYPGAGTAQRVLLVGLGKPEEIDRSAVRRGAAVAAKRARTMAPRLTIAVPGERGGVTPRDLGQVIAEGAGVGAWTFTEMKQPSNQDKKPELTTIEIATDQAQAAEVDQGRRIGEAVAAGQELARYLQMLPGNVCTPTYLADRARALAQAHGHAITVLDRAAMTKEGMGALLAVAQGSQQEPRFVVIEYKNGGAAAPLVLVGKGVTFDSGGISIKPAASMEEMKYDMSGAAAVLGTFEVLGRLKPKINVVGIIPATENMPSGTAVKPGDVVKSLAGKTIEIINTDAEGRLILSDALAYAKRFKPAAALDAATLTGAVVVALGSVATGIMGNDEKLLDEVRAAGERSGERCWPLPLWNDYRDLLKSDIADMKNSAGRGAGTIAGGWFLREFVDGFPWVHLDIAGTAYTENETPYQSKGPTAMGVRLFTEFLLKRAGG
jgi:leucyl aminopeptidase